ncbi:MAG: caspase family protein [Deferribacteres bacterium]|nr:caspase family protein [candidate division KSB1 bacterium]MCB9512631.1 caspase family protein [Deferribacteres bacterium]
MKKVGFFLAITFFIAHPANAQHARAYSEPGILGLRFHGPDKQAPSIVITKPAAETTRSKNGTRGLSIVPEATGEIALLGYIEDDRHIASLAINGHDIQLWGNAATKKKFGLKLKAPAPGKVIRLAFVATDKAGNTTEDAFDVTSAGFEAIADTRSGRPATLAASSPTKANYWALVVAVGEYNHPSVTDLDYPANDAKDVALTLYQNYTFEKDRILILNDPTRAELIGALADFAPSGKRPLTPNDNLLVFYAGHGHFDENYSEGYWLPSDAEKDNRANWVSNSDVQRAFRGIQAQHILLLSDACFSGSMFATRSPFTIAIEEAYKERSRKAITAGNLTQVPDRSIFKEYLVKRLQENTNTFLDAGTLYSNLKAPVTNNSPTRQRPLYGVIQQTGDEGGEFIFVRRE